MILNQSLLEVFLASPFGTRAFGRDVRPNVFADVLAELNGALAIFGTAKLSGAGVTASSALHRRLQDHALPSTTVVDLVVIKSVELLIDFFKLSYL